MSTPNVNQDYKVTLYVEDRMTREYLDAVLSANRKFVGFRIVGGARTVLGCIEDDFRRDIRNTFGVVDRDYDRSASSGWTLSYGRCYCLPRHEIENYLLDWELLSNYVDSDSERVKSAGEWRAVALAVARQYVHSVAYNFCLAEMRRKVLIKYPRQAGLATRIDAHGTVVPESAPIGSIDEAQQKLVSSEWFLEIPSVCDDLTAGDWIAKTLVAIENELEKELADKDDAWLKSFPGKEIFRAIGHVLFTDMTRLEELAVFIGESQRESGTVPSDVKDIIDKLLQFGSLTKT